jgi:hypothetical protein
MVSGAPDDGFQDARCRRQVEAMVEAEKRFLSALEQEECGCKGGMFPARPNRRQLLCAFTTVTAGTAANTVFS